MDVIDQSADKLILDDPVNPTSAETRIAKWTLQDGIVRSVGKESMEEYLEDAYEQMAAYRKLAKGQKLPMLADGRKISVLTKEAREFYASETCAKEISALAMMTGSRVSRVILNFFMSINKPRYPMRLFTSEDKAIEWLQQYKVN